MKEYSLEVIIAQLGSVTKLGNDIRIANLPLPRLPLLSIRLHQPLGHHTGNFTSGLHPPRAASGVQDGIPDHLLVLFGQYVKSSSVVREHPGVVRDVIPRRRARDHGRYVAEGLRPGLRAGSFWCRHGWDDIARRLLSVDGTIELVSHGLGGWSNCLLVSGRRVVLGRLKILR